jgi:hypothetical protein
VTEKKTNSYRPRKKNTMPAEYETGIIADNVNKEDIIKSVSKKTAMFMINNG